MFLTNDSKFSKILSVKSKTSES